MQGSKNAQLRAMVGVVCLMAAGRAAANGRLPNSVSLHVNPFDASQRILGATFGLGLSRDCGQSWQVVCESVVVNANAKPDNQGFAGEDFRAAFGAHGEILVEGGNGQARSLDGGRTWAQTAGLPAQATSFLGELQGSDRQPGTAWQPVFDRTKASGESVAGQGQVWATTDSGATWSALPLASDNLVWRQLRQQAGDPARLTVVGYHALRYAGPYLAHSSDGGQSWSMPALAAGVSGRFLRLHLVIHPTDASRLLVGGVRNTGDGVDHFELYRSDDGGASVTLAQALPGEIRNIAAAEDGETLWAALQDGGLWRSQDAGRTFAQLPLPRANSCVTLAGGLLWACGNGAADGFALAVSADGGQSFHRAAMLSQLTLPTFTPGTPAQVRCPAAWSALAPQLGANPAVGGAAPALPATPTVDAAKACTGKLAATLQPSSPTRVAAPAAAGEQAPSPASEAGTGEGSPAAAPAGRGGGCHCSGGGSGGEGALVVAMAALSRLSRRGRRAW